MQVEPSSQVVRSSVNTNLSLIRQQRQHQAHKAFTFQVDRPKKSLDALFVRLGQHSLGFSALATVVTVTPRTTMSAITNLADKSGDS